MGNSNDLGKILGALLLGAITGAALGVLFAPEKGRTTRNNIADGAKDLASDIKQKVSDQIAALRKKADDLEDMAKETAEDALNTVKNKAEEAKSKL